MITGKRYYDTTMLRRILNISSSKLKREMAGFELKDGDYLVYNNRFLLTQNAVIGFIYHIVTKRNTDKNDGIQGNEK